MHLRKYLIVLLGSKFGVSPGKPITKSIRVPGQAQHNKDHPKLTTDLLDILLKQAPLLNFLAEQEPVNVADLPEEHLAGLKLLENLGIVYRRNSRGCALQKQRLAKLIERESRYVPSVKREMCLSTFSRVLQLNKTPPSSDSEKIEHPAANAHHS